MSAGIATEAVRGTSRAASPRVVVASYARLSKAKGDGRGSSLAIDRQQEANREYIERVHPGAIVVEFNDDGFSGFLDVERPAWTDMLARVEAGEFAAVVAWHADRISRQVGVAARLVGLCERTRTELHTALGGWHSDPTRLYIESIVAESESRQKRERMLSKHKEIRKAGGYPGGARRFGFEPAMTAVRESEATEVRDMAARVLGGESLKSIAADLNRRGVLTSTGAQWRGQTVRQVLAKEYLAGLRDGRKVWPAVLDLATHEALGRLFDGRSGSAPSSARKYLLSGIAVCGRCGAKMAGSFRHGKLYAYVCPCGVQRVMADVDEMVTAYTVARLAETDANGLLTSDAINREMAALTAEQDVLAERRKIYARQAATGAIDDAAYKAFTAAIAEREGEVKAEIEDLAERQAAPIRALDGATGPLAPQTWAAWTEDTTGRGQARQRQIIALFWDVTLHPVGRGRRPFSPDSVSIVPKELPSDVA